MIPCFTFLVSKSEQCSAAGYVAMMVLNNCKEDWSLNTTVNWAFLVVTLGNENLAMYGCDHYLLLVLLHCPHITHMPTHSPFLHTSPPTIPAHLVNSHHPCTSHTLPPSLHISYTPTIPAHLTLPPSLHISYTPSLHTSHSHHPCHLTLPPSLPPHSHHPCTPHTLPPSLHTSHTPTIPAYLTHCHLPYTLHTPIIPAHLTHFH